MMYLGLTRNDLLVLIGKLGEFEASASPIRVSTFTYKGYTFNLSYRDDQKEGLTVSISSISEPDDDR